MTFLKLHLSKSLHKDLKVLAQEEGVSVNQFISQALAEKIAVLKQSDGIAYYRSRPEVSRGVSFCFGQYRQEKTHQR
jgi:HicB family